MGYHPRIECEKVASFQTTRCMNSELWFVNNRELEEDILAHAGKYCKTRGAKLYALSIEGNHVQFPAIFPRCNRSDFMRDFNSSIAKSVQRYVRRYRGGKLWGRRYSGEYLPSDGDVEEQFFYTVLQPVQDGLVDDIKEYPGYNCFNDAVNGIGRKYHLVCWKEYNDARRYGKKVDIKEFMEEYELKYERVPGYEALSQDEYRRMMEKKLAERTKVILEKRVVKKSLGVAMLKRVVPGSRPHNTKTSTIKDHRPRILSKDKQRREAGEEWYFSIYSEYKQKSKEYRSGNLTVEFPKGTYRPPLFTVARTEPILSYGV